MHVTLHSSANSVSLVDASAQALLYDLGFDRQRLRLEGRDYKTIVIKSLWADLHRLETKDLSTYVFYSLLLSQANLVLSGSFDGALKPFWQRRVCEAPSKGYAPVLVDIQAGSIEPLVDAAEYFAAPATKHLGIVPR